MGPKANQQKCLSKHFSTSLWTSAYGFSPLNSYMFICLCNEGSIHCYTTIISLFIGFFCSHPGSAFKCNNVFFSFPIHITLIQEHSVNVHFLLTDLNALILIKTPSSWSVFVNHIYLPDKWIFSSWHLDTELYSVLIHHRIWYSAHCWIFIMQSNLIVTIYEST